MKFVILTQKKREGKKQKDRIYTGFAHNCQNSIQMCIIHGSKLWAELNLVGQQHSLHHKKIIDLSWINCKRQNQPNVIHGLYEQNVGHHNQTQYIYTQRLTNINKFKTIDMHNVARASALYLDLPIMDPCKYNKPARYT